MLTRKVIPLLSAALLCSGCIPRQPTPTDPFAGLFDGGPPAFPDLTVAVFISENTRNSARFGLESARLLPGGSDFAQQWIEQDIDRFKRNFKSAIRIERMEDASKAGADLVAVIDLLVEAKGTFRVQRGLIFMTPDGRSIDTVRVESAMRVSAFNPMKAIQKANTESREKLYAALRNSAPLAEFSRKRGAANLAQRAPAPPPPRRYHSDVDQPNYSLPERDRAYALVVGVESYENLPPADFAERDAQAIRAHLKALGYPDRNILFLTGRKAGKAAIEKYVESWLPRNVPEASRVLVYFSGHGAPDPASGQAYLVPWDGDPKFLENTAYPVKRLYEKLDSLRAREVVVALDACFSGAGGRSVLPKGTRPLVTKVDIGTAASGKLAVLAASSADEITGTDESQGHGLFTYYLLKGLNETRGEGDLQRLYDYLRPKVQDAAQRENRDQTPQILPADLGARARLKL